MRFSRQERNSSGEKLDELSDRIPDPGNLEFRRDEYIVEFEIWSRHKSLRRYWNNYSDRNCTLGSVLADIYEIGESI